jgi:hypothetical protein
VFERHRDLEALTVLCRELAALGLDIGITDARPAIWVRADRSAPRWWISVDTSGEVFECRESNTRFPAEDPARAAALIAEQLRATPASPDEAS